MNIPKYLYRGDKRGNVTIPERHYSDGLISKLIQKGDPAYVTKYGLLETLCQHIHPESEQEKEFLNRSHYLSFTESIDVAKHYLSEGSNSDLVKVNKYFEKRYLFTFDLSNCKIQSLSKSIYKVAYKCNRNLIEGYSPDTRDLVLLRERSCSTCNDINYHTMLLIDVVRFLNLNQNFKRGKSLELPQNLQEQSAKLFSLI